MTKPLALLIHEKLMPGSQLVSRFEERDYRVLTTADPAQLTDLARSELPMIVVADLTSRRGDVLEALGGLKSDPATAHVPILAYAARADGRLPGAAKKAGITVLATDATVLLHLDQYIQRCLELD